MIQGKLSIRRDNYLEGTVLDNEREILISGRNDLNRAMNEDIVALRIKPKDQWKVNSFDYCKVDFQIWLHFAVKNKINK